MRKCIKEYKLHASVYFTYSGLSSELELEQHEVTANQHKTSLLVTGCGAPDFIVPLAFGVSSL